MEKGYGIRERIQLVETVVGDIECKEQQDGNYTVRAHPHEE
jgi:hypothetical protein